MARFGLVLALFTLGIDGCPVQTSCGVYDRRQEHPHETDAQSWTCRATVQLAEGTTITSPERVKEELTARQESIATRLASLRTRLDRLDDEMVALRGMPGDDTTAGSKEKDNLQREIDYLQNENEQIDRQMRQLESIQYPGSALVLKNGTWAVKNGRVTVRAQAPYREQESVIIPYVIRSQNGDILETGAFRTESIGVERAPERP
jgi:hypothetical protein